MRLFYTGSDGRVYEDLDQNILCNGRYDEGKNYHYYLNGYYHKEDGPAISHYNILEWYLNGNLIYSKCVNNLELYKDLSESFKMSIIKYELSK
jgi:hypothetical protein